MWDTVGEARTNSLAKFFYGLLHMDVPVLADQQKLTWIRYVQTLDVIWRICWEWWIIGMDGKRESGKSVLSEWFDDNDVIIKKIQKIRNNCVIINKIK